MRPLNVLLLESIHPVAEAHLKEAGLRVRRLEGALGAEALAAALDGVHLLGIRSKTQLTEEVLASPAAAELLAVGAFCIGTNQVELSAAMRRGVCVFNAPFSNTRSVAEMVLAEVVMLSRQLGDRSMQLHRGLWRKLASGAHEVRGKTLGVVGYGHIGSQVGVLAELFGMRVYFFDIQPKLPMGNNAPLPSLPELLGRADFVTLHVPETPSTRGMIGAAELAAMRPGACLINASRGSVVDVRALAEALRGGHLGGAAVDVYPEEPEASSSEGFHTPLQGLPNVVLTPHIGGSTLEAQESIGREVAVSLVRFARLGSTTGSVNFPHCELPPSASKHRVVHVHQNVPGVLRDVNRIVGDAAANVHAQLLATNSEIGYLIMDLDLPVMTQVAEGLLRVPTTIRARALN